MELGGKLWNIAVFGVGAGARRRKRAAKDEVRADSFVSDLWVHDGAVARRRYASYDDYIRHQALKLDVIEERLTRRYADDVERFTTRFTGCPELADARSVLCLGARLGAEVEALLSLGHFAVGIDLNPGDANRFVLPGDFHDLVFADGSLDAVYTNVIDHVYDLERMAREVARLLRPNGIFVVDLIEGFDEGFTPGRYEALIWRTVDQAQTMLVEASGFALAARRPLGLFKRQAWTQLVLRRPA